MKRDREGETPQPPAQRTFRERTNNTSSSTVKKATMPAPPVAPQTFGRSAAKPPLPSAARRVVSTTPITKESDSSTANAEAALQPQLLTEEQRRWAARLEQLRADTTFCDTTLATVTRDRDAYHNVIERVIDEQDTSLRTLRMQHEREEASALLAVDDAYNECQKLDTQREDLQHELETAMRKKEATTLQRIEELEEDLTLAADELDSEKMLLQEQEKQMQIEWAAFEKLRAREELMKSETYGLSEEAAGIVAEGQRAKQHAAVLRQRSIATEIERREKFSKYEELKGTIRVYCRVKGGGAAAVPASTSAASSPSRPAARFAFPDAVTTKREMDFEQQRENATSTGMKRTVEHFAFDRVYTPADSQVSVFDDVGPLVDCAVDGYAVCIMAYGQTGSGKTYTMEGPDINDETTMGITPRAVKKVFDRAAALQKDGWVYRVTCFFVEIYNEAVRDLLDGSSSSSNNGARAPTPTNGGGRSASPSVLSSSSAPMRSGAVQPPGSERIVSSPQEVHKLLEQAVRNRSVAKTNMNERSSRSHCVFTMQIDGSNASLAQRSAGTLCLVDLAGSERVNDSGVQGTQLQEAININKSLAFLGRCITGLSNGGSAGDWRACKLTQLLQNYLLGKVGAKVLMLVNVSDKDEHANESMNSLRFATGVNRTSIGPAKKRLVSTQQ